MRRLFPVLFLAGLLSGCASANHNELITQLQSRVSELESEADRKDEDITDLRNEVKDLSYQLERTGSKSSRSVSSAPIALPPADGPIIRVSAAPEKVQTALQSAGYYKGNVDGKAGAKTREAIAQFQRDRGLKADGVVGKATWAELKTFLE